MSRECAELHGASDSTLRTHRTRKFGSLNPEHKLGIPREGGMPGLAEEVEEGLSLRLLRLFGLLPEDGLS